MIPPRPPFRSLLFVPFPYLPCLSLCHIPIIFGYMTLTGWRHQILQTMGASFTDGLVWVAKQRIDLNPDRHSNRPAKV